MRRETQRVSLHKSQSSNETRILSHSQFCEDLAMTFDVLSRCDMEGVGFDWSHACVFAVELLRQIESELRVRYGRRAALSVLIPLVTRVKAGGVATFGTTATVKPKWRHDHPRARAPPVCV